MGDVRLGGAGEGPVEGRAKAPGVTYNQLVEKRAGIGVTEAEPNIRNKLARGKFTAVRLLQCLEALGAKDLRLDYGERGHALTILYGEKWLRILDISGFLAQLNSRPRTAGVDPARGRNFGGGSAPCGRGRKVEVGGFEPLVLHRPKTVPRLPNRELPP